MGKMKEAYIWLCEQQLQDDPNGLSKYAEYLKKKREERGKHSTIKKEPK
jgi:hypothetical protein